MKESEIKALFKLLSDPDEYVSETVKKKLLLEFDFVQDKLLKEIESTQDTSFIDKANELLFQYNYNRTINDLYNWNKSKNKNYFNGYFIINRFFDIKLEIKTLYNFFDNVKRKIQFDTKNLSPLEHIKLVNFLIFNELGFKVNTDDNVIALHLLSNNIQNKVCSQTLLTYICFLTAKHLDIPFVLLRLGNEYLIGYQNILYETNSPSHITFFYYPSKNGLVVHLDEMKMVYRERAKTLEIVSPEMFLNALVKRFSEIAFLKRQTELHNNLKEFSKILQNEI